MICNQEPAYSNVFNPPVRDLISRLLIKDPRHRVTIEYIKSNIFMSHVRLLQIIKVYFLQTPLLTTAIEGEETQI